MRSTQIKKPNKQTVYLPTYDPLTPLSVINKDLDGHESVVERQGYFFTPEQLNEYTEKVIKQTLETDSENKNSCA